MRWWTSGLERVGQEETFIANPVREAFVQVKRYGEF